MAFLLQCVALAGDVDPDVVADLEQRARRSRSDGVVVLHRDQVVVEWYRKGPRKVRSMSVTKSILSLAIGRLVTTGDIVSVDDTMTTWFPEWEGTDRAGITLRHVLEHTTGLRAHRNARADVYRSDNAVQAALATSLEEPPGTRFRYNNVAVNLLPELIFRVVGRPVDEWLQDELLTTIGVTTIEWDRDRAGNPYGLAGLAIEPRDLARIGQLVLNRGRFQGEQLISEDWLAESLTPSAAFAGHGWLWWLDFEDMAFDVDEANLDALRQAGVSAAFVDQLHPLIGHWPDVQSYAAALRETLGPGYAKLLSKHLGSAGVDIPDVTPGRLRSASANGWLGQYLVIYPDLELVGVRMVSGHLCYRRKKHGFDDFPWLVGSLIPDGGD